MIVTQMIVVVGEAYPNPPRPLNRFVPVETLILYESFQLLMFCLLRFFF